MNGTGGGFDTFATQLARLHGVEVIAVERAEKLELLRGLGAEHAIDYRERDVTRIDWYSALTLDVKTYRSPLAYAGAFRSGGADVTVVGGLPRPLQVSARGAMDGSLLRSAASHCGPEAQQRLGYLDDLFEVGNLMPVIDGNYTLARHRRPCGGSGPAITSGRSSSSYRELSMPVQGKLSGP